MIVVVKIGTSSLTDDRGEVAVPAIAKLCSEVAALRSQRHHVIVVTSGAIAAGPVSYTHLTLPTILLV